MLMTNDGKHLNRIVAETRCLDHASNQGIPCWAIEGGKPGNFVVGVCGKRIRAAGYTGTVSPMSMRTASVAKAEYKKKRLVGV